MVYRSCVLPQFYPPICHRYPDYQFKSPVQINSNQPVNLIIRRVRETDTSLSAEETPAPKDSRYRRGHRKLGHRDRSAKSREYENALNDLSVQGGQDETTTVKDYESEESPSHSLPR